MSFPKKEITVKSFKHHIRINYNNQHDAPWNEICVRVLEVFGLPGDRFMYRPHPDHIHFDFESKKDKTLCEILLSEYL